MTDSIHTLLTLQLSLSKQRRKTEGCIMVMEFERKMKKLIRGMLWRIIKAEIKKTKDKNKKHISFNYDPISYSLNFDPPKT
ncbi:hypothetical protein Bca4012_067587 [Brassica carinata]